LREWNRGILDVFDEVMGFVLETIMMLLGTAPADFSPGGFALADAVGQTLTGVGLALVVLFFFIDMTGAAITFRVKDRDEIIKLILGLILGAVFVRASFWLSMYIFETFQTVMGLVVNEVGGGTNLEAAFSNSGFGGFSSGMRGLIDERNAFDFYVLSQGDNTVLFIFLIFTFLGIFGMLLSVLLVPIAIFIELFIYSAFSPIPMSTLFSSQKQIGIAFLKTYASVCIRGAVVLFGIALAVGVMNSPFLNMPHPALTGVLFLIIPIAQMTSSIMVMKKAISGAESFAKALTGAVG